jgi:hypothetical protein
MNNQALLLPGFKQAAAQEPTHPGMGVRIPRLQRSAHLGGRAGKFQLRDLPALRLSDCEISREPRGYAIGHQ